MTAYASVGTGLGTFVWSWIYKMRARMQAWKGDAGGWLRDICDSTLGFHFVPAHSQRSERAVGCAAGRGALPVAGRRGAFAGSSVPWACAACPLGRPPLCPASGSGGFQKYF